MMEIREEEGERDSERRDGPGYKIGSDSVIERIRNCPMYSPTRSLTDWRADQVQSPPLNLFGFLFGYEAYCNIETSLGYDDSVFGLQFEYKSHLKGKSTTERPKRKYRAAYTITIYDFRQLFGHKRADAAKTLGVSVPTFKRYCRQNGITWWNGDGCSLVEPKLLNNSVHQNSSGSKPPEVQGEKEISALLGARQDAVTIKAKSEGGILKLQLSSESGFAELQEAVAKRLKSQAFIVEYEDEDRVLILIACDEDWQACVKFFGNQVIRLAIR